MICKKTGRRAYPRLPVGVMIFYPQLQHRQSIEQSIAACMAKKERPSLDGRLAGDLQDRLRPLGVIDRKP